MHCETLVEDAQRKGKNVTLKIYEGAYHGWDGDWSGNWYNPVRKRWERLQADATIAAQSQQEIVTFLKPALGL